METTVVIGILGLADLWFRVQGVGIGFRVPGLGSTGNWT